MDDQHLAMELTEVNGILGWQIAQESRPHGATAHEFGSPSSTS